MAGRAWLVDKIQAVEPADSTSFTVSLANLEYAQNDLLLACAQHIFTGSVDKPTGWTQIGGDTFEVLAGFNKVAWFYKLAGASETDPVFGSSGAKPWNVSIFSIRGVDQTTPIEAYYTAGAPSAGAPTAYTVSSLRVAAPRVLSTNNITYGQSVTAKSLLFYSCSNYLYGVPYVSPRYATQLAARYIEDGAGGNQHALGIWYNVQDSTGDSASFNFEVKSASSAGQSHVIAVKSASGDGSDIYRKDSVDVLRTYTGLSDAATFSSPNAIFGAMGASIAGVSAFSATASTVRAIATQIVSWSRDPVEIYDTVTGTGTSQWHGAVDNLTANISGKTIAFRWRVSVAPTSKLGPNGFYAVFGDNANHYAAYRLRKSTEFGVNENYWVVIDTAKAPDYGGSMDWANLRYFAFLMDRKTADTYNLIAYLQELIVLNDWVFVGGHSENPLNQKTIAGRYGKFAVPFDEAGHQGAGQFLFKAGFQIGDGSVPTYCKLTGGSFENPTSDDVDAKISAQSQNITFYPSASCTFDLSAAILKANVRQTLKWHASSSTSAAVTTTGLSVIGFDAIWKTGIPCTGVTFSRCYELDMKGADLTNVTVTSTANTDSATTITEDGCVMDGCSIDGTGAAYAIELGTAVTAITLTDCTITAGSTDKIHVLKTTGTVTITISGTTSLVAGDVTTEGATVSIVAPPIQRGLQFTGLLAGSFVRVVKNSDESQLFVDTNSATSETWDDATSGSLAVSYMIQKAGYEPIGPISVTVTGAESGGIQTVPVTQVPARWYVASSGLTLNTNAFANATTKKFGLTAASTLQNFASYLLEQWITLGGTGGAFANKAWPLAANGPNSFTWLEGWEADLVTYPNTITNFSRDGMRYLDTNEVMTAQWAAILTSGVPSGARVRFQQTDGGTTQEAAVASGDMDQLVQVYGDASHGNFDRRGYLVLKVQEAGYDQAEADVVATYGNLEDQLYVVGLAPTANGVATGDPALTITITDHGATPVTWNGKDFSITITDNASPSSGTDLLRELRYNFEAGGTYQGKDAFNWHDLIQTNGSAFKTVRGKVYGDTGAALKGVRVVKNDGTTAHPDFTLFTADDGTTYSPPVTANVSVTGLVNAGAVPTRLQIINDTAVSASAWVANTAYATGDLVLRTSGIGTENTAGLYFRATTGGTSHAVTEPTWNTTPGGTTSDGTVTWTTYKVLFYDDDPAATSYTTTYIDGEEFAAGESVEVRFAEMNGGTTFKTAHSTAITATTGFSIAMAIEADSVYATNALDGSSYEATFSPNFTDDYIVLDSNTDFSGKSAYAYFCYTLTTSQGMYEFWDGVTALDEGNYRINTATLNLYFDESAGFVKQTDDVRIFRDDGLRPALDPTTGGAGIEINWRVPVNVVTTGGSALTPTESAYLLALPIATDNATAVRTELATELGRIDATVSSRLASASYTAPPSASAIASQVLTNAQSTPIHSDAKKMNGATITGTGTSGDKWRGA